MNKMLLYSFAVVGLAVLFWACGEGTVSGYTESDQWAEFLYQDDAALLDLVDRAANTYCSTDLNPDACLAATRPDVDYKRGGLSSSSPVSSSIASSSSITSPYAMYTSSSYNPFASVYSSSSTRPMIIPITLSSSSSLVRSSSSVIRSSSSAIRMSSSVKRSSSSSSIRPGSSSLPENIPWGSCVANSGNPGSRGVPLKWQFSLNKDLFSGNVQVLTKSTYSWEFDNAEPSTYEGLGTRGVVSSEVTYAESGRYGARATMSYNGQSQTVECDSADIMGYPITDCECVPDKKEVDVAKESIASGATVVKWTVSKCVSEDKTFSYEWEEGMTGEGASASMTLKEKITYRPKVTVRNSDNGSMVVTCDAVNTIDSDHPEFEFKAQNTKIAMPAGESTVYFNMQPGWHNNDGGNCTFSCQVPTGGLLTVTIGTQTKTDYYVAMGIPISSTTGMTPMKVTLSVAAECMLGW